MGITGIGIVEEIRCFHWVCSFQVNYWNSNVNEVQGIVMDQEGKVVHRLFGKWHEGLYCGVAPSAKCIWRPGETRRSALPQEAPERSDRGRECQITPGGPPCVFFNNEVKNLDAKANVVLFILNMYIL